MAFSAKKKKDQKRTKSFMEKPKEGWTHDDEGIKTAGMFVQYPVTYVGYYELKESLRAVGGDDQTLVIREAIALVAEEAPTRPREKRKPLKAFKAFEGGKITIADVNINLGISANGFVLTPPTMEGMPRDMRVIAFHDMTTVSLVAGGESSDYCLVGYVAKEGPLRACFVYDCGEKSDDVLTTIGQAFVAAQDQAVARQKAQAEAAQRAKDQLLNAGKKNSMPTAVYDAATPDPTPSQPEPVKEEKPAMNDYDLAPAVAIPVQPEKPPEKEDPQALLDRLNASKPVAPPPVEAPQLKKAAKTKKKITPEEERKMEEVNLRHVEWVYFSQNALQDQNKLSLDELRKQFLAQAKVAHAEDDDSSSDEDD